MRIEIVAIPLGYDARLCCVTGVILPTRPPRGLWGDTPPRPPGRAAPCTASLYGALVVFDSARYLNDGRVLRYVELVQASLNVVLGVIVYHAESAL